MFLPAGIAVIVAGVAGFAGGVRYVYQEKRATEWRVGGHGPAIVVGSAEIVAVGVVLILRGILGR